MLGFAYAWILAALAFQCSVTQLYYYYIMYLIAIPIPIQISVHIPESNFNTG